MELKEVTFVASTDVKTKVTGFAVHEHEKRLAWPRRITCHSFRHALGTHLYENGVDLLTIKSILGHKALSSTTIYVHLAKTAFSDVVNPLDLMGGDVDELL